MKDLDRAGCEWMKLKIDTYPTTSPTDWEASIDDEVTWVTATAIDGLDSSGNTVSLSAWLVAGPDYEPGPAPDFTVTASSTRVKARLIDNPETIIRNATRISLRT